MAKKTDTVKLEYWQKKLEEAESAYSSELERMEAREKLYRGDGSISAMVKGDTAAFTPYVRNICAELIESQIDSTIPQPKVTAMRKEDEPKAKLIEDMIRSELDRMPMEQHNDMNERTGRIQGSCFSLCEWDDSKKTPLTNGEISVGAPHPRQIIPQSGVYSDIEDMDFIFLKIPQTKGYIERRFGVSMENESEDAPEVRNIEGDTSDDMVTQIVVYFRNDDGGIGKYSYVNDTQLEDIEDYQARWTSKCSSCGATEPPDDNADDLSDLLIIEGEAPVKPRKMCPICGGDRFKLTRDDYETVFLPIELSDGSCIGGEHPVPTLTEDGEGGFTVGMKKVPARIPFYKPNIYPVIMQKNVSLFGSFLGDSDIDKLAGYQNAIKRLDAKIIEKLLASGSILSLPGDTEISTKNKEMRVVRPKKAADIELIKVFNLEASIEQDLAYRERIYEEAKQAIGVTDSYLGRIDRTATSGKAKEFSAAQAAGRMESKRVMKNAAWARLFEAIFKFKLAYDDDKRPIASRNIHGSTEYKEFNRYDFLEKDENGDYYWNDMFLFSCDSTSPLASNREAMWQETRMNLQTGAFGDPAALDTLILFWTKMEELHYPGASETKASLEEKLKAQMQQNVVSQAQADAQAQIDREMQASAAVIGQAEADAAMTLQNI